MARLLKFANGASALNKVALLLLQFYKKGISPFLPHVCRFVPSCSEYARGCFQEFNSVKALRLTIMRLLRCQPFCKGGFDPVPVFRKNSVVRIQ